MIRRQRHGLSGIGWLLLFPLALGSLGGAWWWKAASAFPSSRVSFLVVGDPVMVVTWDQRKQEVFLLSLPAATRIDATRGYGRYSLDALWKLGDMDGRPGSVLRESVEDALGLPIPWYLKPSRSDAAPAGIDFLRQLFSVQSMWAVLVGATRSNIAPPRFLVLAISALFLRANQVVMVPVQSAIGTEMLPDGTREPILMPERMDSLVGTDFEEAPVRAEGLSVALYNTTDMPTLGQRAARILSHAGALVVTVGNDQPVGDGCIVRGKKELLAGATVRFIRRYFGCSVQVAEEVQRADILVYLGKDFEMRYLPSQK